MAVALVLILGACFHRPPSPSTLDPATIDFDAVAMRTAELSGADCNVLALRAHVAVLRLESTSSGDTPEELLPRYRLHALAAELGECAGLDRPPFYGTVGGKVLDLHDLRNGQIFRMTPGVAELDVGPVAEGRRENVLFHAELMEGDARFADADIVLELLQEPRVRGRPPHQRIDRRGD